VKINRKKILVFQTELSKEQITILFRKKVKPTGFYSDAAEQRGFIGKILGNNLTLKRYVPYLGNTVVLNGNIIEKEKGCVLQITVTNYIFFIERTVIILFAVLLIFLIYGFMMEGKSLFRLLIYIILYPLYIIPKDLYEVEYQIVVDLLKDTFQAKEITGE
jgi:hypothetical protein